MSYQRFSDVIRVVREDRGDASSLAEHLGQQRQPTPTAPLFAPELSSTALLALESDPNVQAHIETCRKQAEADGKAAAAAAAEEQQARFDTSISRLNEAAINASHVMAEQVVELALVIAEELVGHAVAQDEAQLVACVSRALSMSAGAPRPTLRICGEDARRIEDAPELDLAGVRIETDDSLRSGDCVVETAEAVVDSRFASRTAAVREALIDILSAPEDTP